MTANDQVVTDDVLAAEPTVDNAQRSADYLGEAGVDSVCGFDAEHIKRVSSFEGSGFRLATSVLVLAAEVVKLRGRVKCLEHERDVLLVESRRNASRIESLQRKLVNARLENQRSRERDRGRKNRIAILAAKLAQATSNTGGER